MHLKKLSRRKLMYALAALSVASIAAVIAVYFGYTILGTATSIITLIGVFAALFSDIENIFSLYNKYFGRLNLELLLVDSQTSYNLNVNDDLSLIMTLRNLGSRPLTEIRLRSLSLNPDLISGHFENIDQLTSLQPSETFQLQLSLKAISSGSTDVKAIFIVNGKYEFCSPCLTLNLTNEPITSKALSARYSYFYPSPYLFCYFLREDKLIRSRAWLPAHLKNHRDLRDPIKQFLFNKSKSDINIDEINLVLDDYFRNISRAVIQIRPKGLAARDVLTALLNPDKQKTNILGSHFIEIPPNSGHNNLIELETGSNGYFRFHFSITFFENDKERIHDSDSFDLTVIDASNNHEIEVVIISSMRAFDDALAERLLRAPKNIWQDVVDLTENQDPLHLQGNREPIGDFIRRKLEAADEKLG